MRNAMRAATNRSPRAARGFGTIAAVMVVVVLAAIAAAVVRLGWSSQWGRAQGVSAARATQAARTGAEWGLYQALKGGWTSCSSNSQTLTLAESPDLRVTVSCDSRTYSEGESSPGTARTVRVFTIDAVACTTTGSCPDNTAATGAGYVERRRQVQAAN